MENIKKQYHKELQNLEIGLDETITVQLVGKRFRKKALRVHSDKTRLGDDEEFKELVNVCNRLVDAIEKTIDNQDDIRAEKSKMHSLKNTTLQRNVHSLG